MGDTGNNKVQFNLKNVHYALLENGVVPTWATPVAIPGAVTLTLEPQGATNPFYADGIVFYRSTSNNGYSGDLEVARIPDRMLVDVWGFEIDEADGVMIENANAESKDFALLYQIDGDKNEDFYCLYNCSGTRPGIGGETNTETKTPSTRKSTISAVPLIDGRVMARTTTTTTEEIKESWFTKVYEKEVAQTVQEE